MAEDKSRQAWLLWKEGLSKAAQAALEPEERRALPTEPPQPVGDDTEWTSLCDSLSSAARAALDAQADKVPVVDVDDGLACPCLIECPDGEWAVMRKFKSFEGLARRIGQLEREDVVVWAVFGIPMTLTTGPQRYLKLPDGKSAISIPMYEGGPVKVVPVDLLEDLPIQEDGFVGPYELANTKVIEAKAVPVKKLAGKKKDDDDEDDDEDDDD